MTEPSPPLQHAENALRSLVKLIKAVQYYPPAHPSLKGAVRETREQLAPLLEGGENFLIRVRKEGFSLDERPVGQKNAILQKLAPFLFARRIQTLLFLSDLTEEDLRNLARCLTLEARELTRRGGIRDVMVRERISTIWVNEVDLANILELKEQIEAEKEGHYGEDEEPVDDDGEGGARDRQGFTAEEWDLASLVAELRQEKSDQRFRDLSRELLPLIPASLQTGHRHLVLEALHLLAANATDPGCSSARREYALHAITQVASDGILDFLVECLSQPAAGKDRDAAEKIRTMVRDVFTVLPSPTVVRHLMTILARENHTRVRRLLAETLVRQGKRAVPVLLDYLDDEPWFLVRNAVAILGEIRDQEAAPHLKPLLAHKDVRVRREAIRALTKIGGQSAVGILLRTLEEGDEELSRQALLSLGAMKNPAAVPTLLDLVREPDPMLKRAEIKKEAIKALGEIGSADAVPSLVTVLGRRRFWRRALQDELRVAAAQALGEIGETAALPVLERAADARNREVARAAEQALKALKRGDRNDV